MDYDHVSSAVMLSSIHRKASPGRSWFVSSSVAQQQQLRVDVIQKTHQPATKAPPPSANKSHISAPGRGSPVKSGGAPNPLKVLHVKSNNKFRCSW